MNQNIYKYFIVGLLTLMVSCSKDNDELKPTYDNTTINFQSQIDIVDEISDNYENLLLDNSPEVSRLILVDSLNETDGIIDAGISEDGNTVYWEFSDGLEYYFLTETSFPDTTSLKTFRRSIGQKGKKSFNSIVQPHSQSATILSPYYYEFGSDETSYINNVLNQIDYNVVYTRNDNYSQSNITIEDYKNFETYGVVAISTHGGITPSGEVFISSGIFFTSDLRESMKDDIDNKRVAVVTRRKSKWSSEGRKALALKSSWFQHQYPNKLDQTLIHMGSCKSYCNTSLSNTLLGNESSFFGWTENTSIPDSREVAIDLFDKLTDGKTVKKAYDEMSEDGPIEGGTFFGNDAYYQLSYSSFDDLSLIEIVEIDSIPIYQSAVIGSWTVTTLESGNVYNLKLFEGGNGRYIIPGPDGANKDGIDENGDSYYNVSWSIEKRNGKYHLREDGFYHFGFESHRTFDVTLPENFLTYPVTSFLTYTDFGSGAGDAGRRYTKN